MPPQPTRFLITRLSALGDAILTLPMACAIKRTWPRSHITWLAEPLAAKLLTGHPAIDDLHVLPRRALRSLQTVLATRRRLLTARPDCAIDAQSLSKSAVWSWLSGAPLRLAFAPPVGREIAPWLATHTVRAETPHVVDRHLELLRPLGIQSPQVEFGLPDYPAARKEMASWLTVQELDRIAVINPGAQWPTKLWVTERFALVARHLRDAHGLRSVVVWCGDAERRMADDIVSNSGGAAILAPRTSLHELAELTRAARLFASPDTGPLHLSVAVGTPSVGLFGPTRPIVCGPYGPQHRAVQARLQEGSSRARRRGDNLAMREIAPELVMDACDELLGEASRRRVG